jgi:hypothetical protein
MNSLLRNWREADRTVRLCYAIVGTKIVLAIILFVAGCVPG